MKRTIKRIRQQYQWNSMNKDIEDYIGKCKLCQKNKYVIPNKMPMVKLPFDMVYLDIFLLLWMI